MAAPTMPSNAESVTPSAVGREFLQRRVAMFGLVAGLIGLGFWLVRIVLGLASGYRLDQGFTTPGMYWHLLASLVLLAVWVVNRFGERSRRFVHASDVGGLALSSVGYQLMGLGLPLDARPEYIMLLALSLGVFSRSIYVPSSARYTLLLCVLIGVPLVLTVYGIYADPAAVEYLAVAAEAEVKDVAPMVSFFTALWWLSITICATAASWVVYGLRSEVSKARQLGQYVLERKLGEGGMGAVYQARHAMLRRPTAIKLLLPDKTGAESIARFEREVQLTAKLTHPNTITIFDYGRTPQGLFYYAMELLDGAALDVVSAVSGPMPAGRVLHILEQVCGALAEAHDVGLIHRDIKPPNIVLGSHGGMADFAKVLDFGLVKEVEEPGAAKLTHANTLTGTPLYMSPESISDPESVDPRSDLYALGAVAYFLLTATHVFEGRTVVEVCSKHLHAEPDPPSKRLESPVPRDVEELVLACLQKHPEDRPPSALDLRSRIRACASFGSWTAEDSFAWWRDHRDAVSAHRESVSGSGTDRTLDVDLEHRAA